MIVRLTGGMGNQLFQYAFGESVSLKRDESVGYHFHRSTWDYALRPFDMPVALVEDFSGTLVYSEPSFGFDSGVYTAPYEPYYRGYWQTEKYFDEGLIRSLVRIKPSWPFSDAAKMWSDRIWRKNSVFVHVRHGDYLNPKTGAYHGVLGREYYDRAFSHIQERVSGAKFFAFSDDPKWCELNWPGVEVVSGDEMEPHEEMWLMSQCQHAIIANSSFSWWGCWLGDLQTDRIVVAPQRWFMNEKIDTSDLIPDRWTRL